MPRKTTNKSNRLSRQSKKPPTKSALQIGILQWTLGVFMLAGIGWTVYAYSGNFFNQGLLYLSNRTDLRLVHIYVVGRRHLEPETLEGVLKTYRHQPILSLKLEDIGQQIQSHPWVKNVQLQRILPNSLIVQIDERQPMAIWQNQKEHFIIDIEGRVLEAYQGAGRYPYLPLVVGKAAPEAAQNLLGLLRNFPDLEKQFKAAVMVGERRWDIYLTSGLILKLPEQDLEDALKRFVNLDKQEWLSQRRVLSIDLRLKDRLIIKVPTEDVPFKEPEGQKI